MSEALSRFVLGCAQLGGLYRPVDDATAEAVLTTAWDAGVRHFDTAPHYGAGLSERRVGAFLRQMPRDSFTLSTKVGRLLVDTDEDVDGEEGFFGGDRRRRVLDYSAAGVLRSLEQSLDCLGLDRVDTVYVHDPDDHLEQAIDEAVPALIELRDQGTVSHVGAGMNDDEPLARIVAETAADRVMLAGRYTLLDRRAENTLLPICRERGVGIIAAGIYNSGLLADPRPGATYDYAEAPSQLVARAVRLREVCESHDVPLRAAAVHFCLRRPEVVAVAVGARSPQQVADNLAMVRHDVPEELWGLLNETGTSVPQSVEEGIHA